MFLKLLKSLLPIRGSPCRATSRASFTTFRLWKRATSFTETWRRVSGLFTDLCTRTCVCLHWRAIKFAKIIKISCCKRATITLKCCWHRLGKNVVNIKYIKK